MTQTRLWNGSTQPLIPADVGWGGGVVMPGESFLTDHPETYGPPWTQDPEADARLEAAHRDAQEALQALVAAETEVSSAEQSLPVSGQQEAPQDGPQLHVNPNGDVINQSGQVVGHVGT